MTTDTFFRNFLSNPNITSFRLRNFMRTTRSRFDAANDDGQWDATIAAIDAVYGPLDKELGEVDATANVGKGKTATTDSMLALFSHAMSEEAPFIKRALKNVPGAYEEFYPHGRSEYNRIAKEDAPTLLKRVKAAAVKYATELGATLSGELAAFEQQYNDARDAQTGNTGTLEQNRVERSAARKAAELVMLSIMHDVARQYPGNVEAAEEFFDLTELYASATGGKTVPPKDA